MIGTIVNTCCIIVGSVAGSILRRGIKEEYQEALFTALGVCTLRAEAGAVEGHRGQEKSRAVG